MILCYVVLKFVSDSFTYAGHSPIFDESFEFTITVPELALLRIAVLDDEFIGDDFIGQYTVPVSCLRTGKLPNN